MERSLQFLLDRQEICDLLHRYASSLDDRNWSLLRTCFTPDAVAIYGELGTQEGVEAIVSTCRAALEHYDFIQHMITNHEIEIEGDTAHSRCYLHAQHTRKGAEGGDNLTIGGKYVDEIIRTSEGWRICKRELCFLWQEGNPALFGSTGSASEGIHGSQGR